MVDQSSNCSILFARSEKLLSAHTKVTINELKDSRNKLLTDAQAILLASPDAEKRTSAQRMLADADLIEQDIASLEKIQKEVRSTTPARPVPGEAKTEDKSQAEKRAFARYIQYGEVSPSLRSDSETRALTTGGNNSTTSGAQFVPEAFYPVLTEAMLAYGNILNIVKNIDTDNGAPTKYATVNDTGNLLTVVGEAQTVNEVLPTISGATISSDFLTTGVVKVSLAELQDSAFNLDEFIKGSFGKRYFRGLSSMVTLGNSSNVASIVTGAAVGFTTTTSATAIGWVDLASTFAALDPAYDADACWSFSQTTRGQLLAVVDGFGRPLYIPSPNAGTFDTLLGKKVVINPFMATAASATCPILYGDHSAYLLKNVRPGLSIMRLNERFMDVGAVGFIGFARAGGAVLDGGTHPIIKMKMKT